MFAHDCIVTIIVNIEVDLIANPMHLTSTMLSISPPVAHLDGVPLYCVCSNGAG